MYDYRQNLINEYFKIKLEKDNKENGPSYWNTFKSTLNKENTVLKNIRSSSISNSIITIESKEEIKKSLAPIEEELSTPEFCDKIKEKSNAKTYPLEENNKLVDIAFSAVTLFCKTEHKKVFYWN